MIVEILAHLPVERLGRSLLHFLWQGTAIGFLYALVRRLLKRSLSARGRYLLASTALVALTAAPFLTFILNPVSGTAFDFAIRVARPEQLLMAAVALWLGGVLFFSIRLIGGWRCTARLRSAASPAMAVWQRSLDGIAAGLGVGRFVRLLVSPLVDMPLVTGWLRPAVLVPVEFLTGFPAEHIRALLAHELAHILRNDYLANILQGVAETVLFYHPAVWWISKQMRVEREQCCDDLAVAVTGDAAAYACALAELEARQIRGFRAAMTANGGSLLDRVRRLIEPAYSGRENLPGPAAVWSMMLLWLAGIGMAAAHAAPTPFAIADTVPPSPSVSAQEPQRPPAKQALAVIKKRTRKAFLYDPLLAFRPAPTAVQPPMAPPEIASALLPDDSKLPGLIYAAAKIDPPESNLGGGHSEPAPVFHGGTRMVLVDVVAKGPRAAVLTQQDFTVFDNGRPQKIASFSAGSATASEPAHVSFADGAVSNRLEEDGATPPNATILLIDQRDTPQSDQVYAIHRIVKFLEKRREKEARASRAGIYTFRTGALSVIQELTDDNYRLIRAAHSVASQRPDYSAGDATDTTRRVLATNDVLEAVARHVAAVAGRKNLVWIGAGFPLVSSRDSELLPDFNPRMEQTARVLADANLAFYAVDATGLEGGLSSMGPISNAETTELALPFPLRNTLRLGAWMPGGVDAFRRLADLTGGMTFSNNNGIEDSIASALDDAALSYTLGFYPAEAEQNPAWHKLKVKVSQRGVRVRSRAKYFDAAATVSAENHRALPSLLGGH